MLGTVWSKIAANFAPTTQARLYCLRTSAVTAAFEARPALTSIEQGLLPYLVRHQSARQAAASQQPPQTPEQRDSSGESRRLRFPIEGTNPACGAKLVMQELDPTNSLSDFDEWLAEHACSGGSFHFTQGSKCLPLK